MRVARLSRIGVAAFALCVGLTGCTTIRIEGLVTDARTGDPVADCEVIIANRSTLTDANGRYMFKVRRWKKTVDFRAEGYLPRSITFTRIDRYPHVNAELQRAGESSAAARFDPYTGEPMTPRFDPYTGKPLQSPR